jgi:hypothetical protein
LGQRTDIPPPPPGIEFDRAEDPFKLEGQDVESYVADHEPPPVSVPAPSRRFPLKNVLRGGFLLLILVPAAWGAIDGAVNGADRSDSGVISEAGDLEVTELRAGDCFNIPAEVADEEEIQEVEAVPCADLHENEVFVVSNYVAADFFPGEAAIWDFADQFCLTAFETYVSAVYLDSALEFGYFYPSREGWADGDHAITCVLYDFTGDMLTGSMRGSGV